MLAYLAKLDHADVETRVKTLIIQGLPAGNVTQSDIASRMHMSARTLHNKLASRNTNFHQLVEDTRRSLASAYMENPRMSVGEIAYLLGFSEASNFSRAFKRWTGRSPSARR